MSFRFVGTALSILGTSTASGYYLAGGAPAAMPHDPAAVVPVVQAVTPPPAKAAAANSGQPRIWVGTGATTNPITGEPLTGAERESGWVLAPGTAAARDKPAPRPHTIETAQAPTAQAPAADVKKPAPHVRTRGIEVAHTPAAEIKKPHTPAPAAAQTAAAGAGAYRIHLDSYRDEHLVGQAWTDLQKAFPTVLGALQSSTVAVDVPGKGRFTRLFAGSFDSRQAAEKACEAIRKARHSQYCHPLPAGRETS